MLSSKALLKMSQVEITEIDPAMLVDITTVIINHELPHEEKLLSYIEQTGNPYCFKSGDIPVRIRFMNNDHDLSDSLIRYFSRLKQN